MAEYPSFLVRPRAVSAPAVIDSTLRYTVDQARSNTFVMKSKRYMAPGYIGQHLLNSAFRYMKILGNRCIGFALRPPLPNHGNVRFFQARIRRFFPAMPTSMIASDQSPTLYSIVRILCTISRIYVWRIAARWNIAIVQRPYAIRQLVPMKEFPCQPIRTDWFPLSIDQDTDLPIALRSSTRYPWPATVHTPRFMGTTLDFLPKAFCQGACLKRAPLTTESKVPTARKWLGTVGIFAETKYSHKQPPVRLNWSCGWYERCVQQPTQEWVFRSYPSYTRHISIAESEGYCHG